MLSLAHLLKEKYTIQNRKIHFSDTNDVGRNKIENLSRKKLQVSIFIRTYNKFPIVLMQDIFLLCRYNYIIVYPSQTQCIQLLHYLTLYTMQ